MQAWWRRFPERFKRERECLRSFGFSLERAEDDKFLEATGTVGHGAKRRRLRVVFSPGTPFIRGDVFPADRGAALSKHQHPYARNFCSWAESTQTWNSRTNNASDLIANTSLLLEAAGEGTVEDVEEEAPHRFAAYYPRAESVLLVPDVMLSVPNDSRGRIHLLLKQDQGRLVALMRRLEVHTAEGLHTRDAPPELRSQFGGSVELVGPWRAVSIPPNYHNDSSGRVTGWQIANAIEEEVLSDFPDFDWRRETTKASKWGALFHHVWGVSFPDEFIQYRNYRRTWLVGLHSEREVRTPEGDGSKKLAFSSSEHGIMHTQVIGVEEARLRTPSLRGLETKKVGVIGLGAVGSPVVEFLARANIGHLVLVDCDRFDFGNITRHALDLRHLSQTKAKAMRHRVAELSPWTKVTSFETRFGAVVGNTPEAEVLVQKELESCDLIICAAADHGVNSHVNRLAVEAGKPAIYVWAVPGGWGGIVLRVLPKESACFECWLNEDDDHYPEEDAHGLRVFEGCSAPSFTGTGFDTLQVALVAARLAVQTLVKGGGEESYPDSPLNYFVIQNRGVDLGVPSIAPFNVPRGESCTICQAATP